MKPKPIDRSIKGKNSNYYDFWVLSYVLAFCHKKLWQSSAPNRLSVTTQMLFSISQ